MPAGSYGQAEQHMPQVAAEGDLEKGNNAISIICRVVLSCGEYGCA